MIDWKGEDLSPKKDGGIEKITIQSGEGYTTPNDGAIVEGECLFFFSVCNFWAWLHKLCLLLAEHQSEERIFRLGCTNQI